MLKFTENTYVSVREELIVMPDGVKLYTRSVVPAGVDKCPIIFMRSPYAKALSEVPLNLEDYNNDRFIKAGYAIVFQHCRGTGESEGVCVPYKNEREDGLSTLEYIRALDFYNGEIYLKGGSYLSSVHLLYLSDKPTDVKGALLEIQTDRMYFRNYNNGCNYNFCNFEWWMSMKKREFPNPDFTEIYRRPYVDIAKRAVGFDLPEFTEMLINNEYNDFWQSDPRTDVVDNIDFPVLFVEGWYDFYIGGMFSMWERLPGSTKAKSSFIVGPYAHDVKTNPRFEYPSLDAGNLPSDYDVEWFNSIRENRTYKYAECGKVNYYSIGADAWYSGEYPKNEITYYEIPLNKTDKGPEQTEISYTYDPKIKTELFKSKGLYRSDNVESQLGITSLLTEEFNDEKSFFGKIKYHLTVSSDCEDTAFYLCVNLVEEGHAYPLTEAISSLSHFYPEYIPGSAVTLDIETPPIAFTAKLGAKIRIDIASVGGMYVPHANVRGHFAKVTESRIAHNTVYLDKSHIDFPTVEY